MGLTVMATFALTGCDMIDKLLKGGEDLVNEKKEYKYDDYAVLLADKNFTFSYNTCQASFDMNGEKSTREYTYDKEDKLWHYVEVVTKDGEEVEKDKSDALDIISFVKQCKVNAALLNKTVDSVYKFSASKNGYDITCNFKNSDAQIDGTYAFNTEGLITSNVEKKTDLNTVEAITNTKTYTYSTK